MKEFWETNPKEMIVNAVCMREILICNIRYTYIQFWTERIAHLAVLWSKTTQTTGGVDGIWENPPTCKMGTFFLMSLTLTEPNLNNFQSNGAKLY